MQKRYRTLAFILVISLLCLCGRIFVIAYFKTQNTALQKNTATEYYGTKRALIFDRNMNPLVEYESKKQSAISDASFVFNVPQRYADSQLCAHIIGYTDYENNGVSGIEKDYNDFLKSIPNQIEVKTYKDAKGNKLLGKGTRIDDSKRCKNSGVKLCIDASVQRIAQNAGKTLHKGAVIVMQSDTGAILASASFPNFNPNFIHRYVHDEVNRPLINRAFTRYNAGSVFKVVICLAALEKGIDIHQKFTCTGEMKSGNMLFHCHKQEGHGTVDMKQALAYSCNTYFIQLAQEVGYERILNLCKRLNIEKQIVFSDSLVVPSGVIPSAKNLTSPAALANFSFGQGELLTSPVWLCSLYSAIFNGGFYCEPHLITGTVIDGEMQSTINHTKTRVLHPTNAQEVLKMLRYAVISGTGKTAASKKCAVAGKTATAQTGIYHGEQEKLISYFIGLFSIKGERYTLLVMCEGGTSGSADCAPVFKEICEAIYDLKNGSKI